MLYVDSSSGTVPVGSLWGCLRTVSRAEHGDDFVHRGVARIRHDPELHRYFDPWWCLGMTDPDIPQYYAWWVRRHYGIDLDPPSWGSHISVIRGEEPRWRGWGFYDDHEVEFEYTHDVRTNGVHFWLDVRSDGFDRIRTCMGLPVRERGYHLTVGRTPRNMLVAASP